MIQRFYMVYKLESYFLVSIS